MTSYKPITIELDEHVDISNGDQSDITTFQRWKKLSLPARTSKFVHCWQRFWTRTNEDLRKTHWKAAPPFVVQHVLPVIFIAACLSAIVVMATVGSILSSTPACLPDGTVNIEEEGYDPWHASEVFTINIGFGSLPFGRAKLIDLTWDLVVGHGGQALLAVISYRVMTASLTRVMEIHAVSCSTFEAVTLQSCSFKSVGKLLGSFTKSQPLRSQFLVFTLLLSSILVLIFPTVSSAMTGYSAEFDARFKFSNGSSSSVDDFQRVWYVIHDGDRLGPNYHKDYLVIDYTPVFSGTGNAQRYAFGNQSQNFQSWSDARAFWMFGCSHYAPGLVNDQTDTIYLPSNTGLSYRGSGNSNPINFQCSLLWQVSNYTNNYGLMGLQNSSSILYDPFEGQDVLLPSPTLNITMFMPTLFQENQLVLQELSTLSDLLWAIVPFGTSWYVNNSIEVDKYQCPFVYWTGSAAEFVPSETFLNNVTCRQQSLGDHSSVRYIWGFAYQSLFYFCIMLFVWAVCTYGLYVDVLLHSRMIQRTQGLQRAILDISTEYQSGVTGVNASMKGNNQLWAMLRNRNISFEQMPTHNVITHRAKIAYWWYRFCFKTWARHEWPWLVGLLLWTVLAPISMWEYATNPFFSTAQPQIVITPLNTFVNPSYWAILWAGTFGVIVIGRAHFSRWIIFAISLAAYIAIHITWIYTDIPW